MNCQATHEWEFETLNVSADGAVLLVEISAPPMNLLVPELIRDLVFLGPRRPDTH
jgi:hypothetical protein